GWLEGRTEPPPELRERLMAPYREAHGNAAQAPLCLLYREARREVPAYPADCADNERPLRSVDVPRQPDYGDQEAIDHHHEGDLLLGQALFWLWIAHEPSVPRRRRAG